MRGMDGGTASDSGTESEDSRGVLSETRLEDLLDHMRYGHAMVAYRKQDGSFRMVRATLIHYEAEFHKRHDPTTVEGAVVYWNVDEQRWTTFQVENFMEWRPTV